MRSDGVTNREMILLSRRVRSALAARDSADRGDRGDARLFRADRQRSTSFARSM
jgi:hypothetical protein